MKRLMLLVVACVLVSSTCFSQEKVTLPDTMTSKEKTLVLNGSGIRSKWFFDLYVAGLYVPEKTSDMAALLEAEDALAIKLHIISKMITSEKMSKATLEGFEKSTRGNTAPIKQQIDQMISVFSDEIKIDDVYDMVYEPGTGTRIMKNGNLAATIEGDAFRTALFGIWLGEAPVQSDLKKKLSGL